MLPRKLSLRRKEETTAGEFRGGYFCAFVRHLRLKFGGTPRAKLKRVDFQITSRDQSPFVYSCNSTSAASRPPTLGHLAVECGTTRSLSRLKNACEWNCPDSKNRTSRSLALLEAIHNSSRRGFAAEFFRKLRRVENATAPRRQ